MPERSPTAAVRHLTLSALAFSLMSLQVKLVGKSLPLFEVVGARAFVSLVLSWLLLRRAGVSPWGRHRVLLVLRGLASFATLGFFFAAAVRLPLAEATVLLYTSPILTAVLAAVFLGEPLTRKVAASMGLGFAGVVLVARPAALFGGAGAGLEPIAVLIGLASALGAASAHVLVRRLAALEHELVVVFYFPLVGVIGSAPFVAATYVAPTPAQWWLLLGIGVAGLVAQLELTRGMGGQLPAARAAVVLYLQIVFAAIWGVVVLSERPGVWTILGGLLILAGTMIAARRDPAVRCPPGGIGMAPEAEIMTAGQGSRPRPGPSG